MGWAIANACSSKECPRATPTNYLQVIVSSGNKNALSQIEKFMKYVEEKISGLLKDINYANINDIQIRYFNKSGKLNELYKGSELTEENYDNIISKIKSE